MKEVRGLLVIHLPSNIFHHTSSDCTGGRMAMQFNTACQNNRLTTEDMEDNGMRISNFSSSLIAA